MLNFIIFHYISYNISFKDDEISCIVMFCLFDGKCFKFNFVRIYAILTVESGSYL